MRANPIRARRDASQGAKRGGLRGWQRSGAAACLCVASACSGTASGEPLSDTPSGVPSNDTEPGAVTSLGSGSEACTGAVASSLVREPEYHTIFNFVPPSECESLARSALFRNTGASPLRVLGVAVDADAFSLIDAALPEALQPGEFLSVPVRFRGTETREANLTIATDAGCQTFEVRGVIAEDSLLDNSAAALDFGDVPAGGTAERSFTFQMQWTAPVKGVTDELLYFGTDPEHMFEIVAGPASPVQNTACEPVTLEVRFTAPSAPGPVVGRLGWGFGGGDGGSDLFARVIAE